MSLSATVQKSYKNKVRDRTKPQQFSIPIQQSVVTAPNAGTRYFLPLKVCRHWTRRIPMSNLEFDKLKSHQTMTFHGLTTEHP